MQQLVRDWLGPLTTLLREAAWSMPLGQGLHLLRSSHSEPAAAVLERLLPWMWIALGLLAVTGFVLFSAEPARMMRSPVFRTKLALLALVIVLTLLLQRRVRQGRETPEIGNAIAKLAGVSLTLWLAIAASGRLIGYDRRLLDYFFG